MAEQEAASFDVRQAERRGKRVEGSGGKDAKKYLPLTFPANEIDFIYCESALYDKHKVINIIYLNMNILVFSASVITYWSRCLSTFVFVTTPFPHIPPSIPPTMTGMQPLDRGTSQPKSLPKVLRAYVHGSLFGKLVKTRLQTEKSKDQEVPHVYMEQWKDTDAHSSAVSHKYTKWYQISRPASCQSPIYPTVQDDEKRICLFFEARGR